MAVIIDRGDEVVEDILTELQGRKGFDDWWLCLDPFIQDEIRQDLIYVVESQ